MCPDVAPFSSPSRVQQRLRLRVCCRAVTKNPAEENSVAEVYFQLGPDSPARRAQVALIEQARPPATSHPVPLKPPYYWDLTVPTCTSNGAAWTRHTGPLPELAPPWPFTLVCQPRTPDRQLAPSMRAASRASHLPSCLPVLRSQLARHCASHQRSPISQAVGGPMAQSA